MPSRHRRELLTAVAVSVAVTAGCSGSSSSSSSTAPTTPSSPGASTPAETPAAIALTPAAMGNGWLFKVVPGGTAVAGQVTLDLCGGGYASEGLRVARRQTAFKRGRIVLSNEVVRYRDGGAAQAYAELKQRAAHCPHHPIAMPEAGGPRVRFAVYPLRTIRGLVKRTIAVRIRASGAGHVEHGFGVYQFAGPWLAAVYSFRDDPATLRAVTRAAVFEARQLQTAGSTSA